MAAEYPSLLVTRNTAKYLQASWGQRLSERTTEFTSLLKVQDSVREGQALDASAGRQRELSTR